ncbi:MAG: O-antigen ligase family protein [Patescibacteria group bacterium]
MNEEIRAMLLRTLAFHATWGHAPTRAELIATAEGSGGVSHADVVRALYELIACGEVRESLGMLAFPDRQDVIDEIRACEAWRERKIRVARGVASRLARISGVRFVALCNTTALGSANDKSDVDFFVVCRKGTLFTTRGLAALPYKLSRRRPGEGERDAVCLSYFVTDDGLDLSSHMLTPDDPYFRYWFLSLLPLYDDGVSEELWLANSAITSSHPFAQKWIAPPDLEIKNGHRISPAVLRLIEPVAKYLQMRTFPSSIRSLMNRDTRVMVTDKALKFHVEDGREEIRAKYEAICKDKRIFLVPCHSREDGNPELRGETNPTSWIPASARMTNALTRTLFSIFWRLAILSLPWQTRWFADASLAGWPWEQGRLSFYVSWIIIVAATIFGFRSIPFDPSPKPVSQNPSQPAPTKMVRTVHFRWFLFLVFFAGSVFFSGGARDVFRAIGQWWSQVFLLGLFVVALRRAAVSQRKIAAWFVISLLPHIALGVWQYATQKVFGSSLLGIAAQDPINLGVSVVEHGVYRLLRIYGGFPHPNIFGGWLAVGLILAIWLASTSETKYRALSWSIVSAFCSMALILTYARGAWIAAIVGIVLLISLLTKEGLGEVRGRNGQFLFVALLCSFVASVIVAIPNADHIRSRLVASDRLEQKSLVTRAGSLREGWEMFLRQPFFGTGPNAELFLLSTRLPKGTTVEPLEPPHNVFLLTLVNFGIVGMILLFMILLPYLLKQLAGRSQGSAPTDCSHGEHIGPPLRGEGGTSPPLQTTRYALLACLVILAIFDHYLLSTWSGQALVAVVFTYLAPLDA